MKSKFSEQELKERALELLYGLLDEDEAEELRRLIASDATAARIFDEARETADRFARAARWEEAPEADVDETAAKNVAVEAAPFDGGASLFLDSALVGGALAISDDAAAEESNAGETDGESSGSNRKKAKRRLNLLRKSKSEAKNENVENGGNVGERSELGRKRRRRKSLKSAKPAKPATFAKSAKLVKSARAARAAKSAPSSASLSSIPASASRLRRGWRRRRVDGASGWATVGRTSSETAVGEGRRRSAARRLWARVPKPTLFQNLIIALAVVALSTAVGFWAQETALQALFRDDFRIQIAAPRTLARGASQTILATTTAPNGKPRRVPIRFSFSDAETGAPLLAHTESGDASGVARFKIPDVSDFPARTLLTISAGEREKETFETILTVVDAPKGNGDASAAARFAASEADVKFFLSTSRRGELSADGATGATGASSPSGGMMGAMGMGAPAPEAAREEAFLEPLADQEGPKFNRAPADGAETLAADEESSADLASVFQFSLSSRNSASPNKKGTLSDGAESVAFDGEAPAEVDAGTNATTAVAPSAAQAFDVENFKTRREDALAELENARANFDELADREEIGESDAAAPAAAVAVVAAEKRGLDVRFYPTGGRLVAGRENVVWFECVDANGRPVVGEFALNDSAGRVATAKTSEAGVGSLRWTPDVDETYSLETAFDGEIAKIVETDGDDDNDDNGNNDDDKAEKALAERGSEDFNSTPLWETFRFPAPTATVERVAFAVPSQVLERGQGIELEFWCENEIPLAATVEKNGVALTQRVWTAKKGRRRVVLPLDANVAGVLNVSLWNCARTPFERIGSAAVYRKAPSNAPTLAATLERNDSGERVLRVAVERQKDVGTEEPVWFQAFWAPTLDEALAELELDETLLYASDERRAETLATLESPPAAEPVLFDNLLEMKENALEKLNAFWRGEAGLAGRVVGLGFFGCGALAALTIFCVLFGALKARRGVVVVLFCAALATFFYFERRRIDFSETLSEAIAVSVDESKAARQRDATVANAPKTVANETAAPTVDGRGTCALFWRECETKPANVAEWNAALPAGLAETDVGFVLAKVCASDGTLFAWKAIPLAETGDGEETE